MLKTKERIITVEDLADATTQAIANAQQEPLVVTENGRPAAYLISVDMFDALLAHLEIIEKSELLAGIDQGEEQFKQGAFKTLDEARAILSITSLRLLNPYQKGLIAERYQKC